MVDDLTGMMHREWNLTNSDANSGHTNRSSHSHPLTGKISDHDNNNNSHNSQHHHSHQHQQQQQQSTQSPPMITTTDYSDPTALTVMHVPQALFKRRSSNTGYDTDGGIGTSRHHHTSSSGYEHLVSPRLPSRRASMQVSKQLPVISSQRRPSQEIHLTVNQSSGIVQNHEDKNEESIYEDNTHRRHIRLSRRIHHSSSNPNHGVHATHSATIPRHDGAFAATSSGRPLRLVFMRHSERANQALGSSWFMKAFQSGSYKFYDPNLPKVLPKRRFDQAYEFDVPLTVHGLKNARHTGRAMMSANIIADVCLSSTALRCIQTCERILTGMNRRERVPIRIEPGLFECPHLNHKIVDSFMTKTELVENGYNLKVEYKPLIQKLHVPESLDEYFDRAVTVMRGITQRYGHHGGTILIVTHAPGLLALTDAIKGIRPNHETFYRTVSAYPPLAIYIAEYDGTKWKHSEKPFSITPLG